jgi:hypothetical protein
VSTLGKLPYAVIDPKTDAAMPKPGDAVVVCRPDGSTSFFLLDIDHRGLIAKASSGAAMSDEEFGQFEAAHKAMLLSFVAQNEKMMATLTEMINDPGFLGDAPLPPLS